ncbi:Transcriptional repressor IclR [Burkholderiales bacterium]|nr:Transcriptional repressor IclR [Burkholderiales bacterium]
MLEFLASTPGGATLTALAAALHLPAPTAHRLLAALEDADYVQAGDDGRYRVGVRAYRVGSAFLEHRNLVAEALPRLERLMETSGETANLAVIESGAAVFVAQVPCRELMRMNARLGARAPMHASGVGKAMLSAMPPRDVDALLGRGALARYTERTLVSRAALADTLAHAALRGYAVDDEEHAVGLRCVAAAITDESGRPWAAVSLAGPTSRLPQERLAELGERVRAAARDITAALGGLPARTREREPLR